jgi:hypothetical protein
MDLGNYFQHRVFFLKLWMMHHLYNEHEAKQLLLEDGPCRRKRRFLGTILRHNSRRSRIWFQSLEKNTAHIPHWCDSTRVRVVFGKCFRGILCGVFRIPAGAAACRKQKSHM